MIVLLNKIIYVMCELFLKELNQMEKRIRKLGGSLIVSIPKEWASSLGFYANSAVNLEINDKEMIVRKKLCLDDLLVKITEVNKHPEFFVDKAVGQESW